MTRSSSRWRSIERQLPLLISTLLLVATAAFALGAYQRVRRELMVAADQRLRSAALSMDALFTTSTSRYGTLVAREAAQPAIVQFLATGKGAASARSALAAFWGGPNVTGHLTLRRPDGTVILDTSRGQGPTTTEWIQQALRDTTVAIEQPRIGPLAPSGDSMYFQAVAPVLAPKDPAASARSSTDHPRRVLGYVSDVRLLDPQSPSSIRSLIGDRAVMLLGSPGVGWTDLEHRRPAPSRLTPMDSPVMVTGVDGHRALGFMSAVRGTPWLIWVEQPLSAALAPMQPLLLELAMLAGLIIITGAGAAWTVSRRFTTPIVSLTTAAEQIAATSGSPASPQDVNEVDRLGDAFERMAARVRDALGTAEAARAEAVATAKQLQTRSVQLEEQTHEAQALAEELEQNFEEAQALSEQLDESNAQLQRAMADTNAAHQALADIVESITDAFIAYDREWRITFINRRAQQYFQRMGAEGEFQGRVVWDLFPESRDTIVEREMMRAMNRRETVSFEAVARDGQWLAIRAYPARDGGVTAVWTDITETKRGALASAFLADASARLSSSLDIEATLRDLAQSIVPSIADWCAIDILADPRAAAGPLSLTRVALVHSDPGQVAVAAELRQRYPIDSDGAIGLSRALRTGEPQFVPVVTAETLASAATNDAHVADLQRLRVCSHLLVPLTARGRPIGALSLAMAESNRHFDEHDLALAQNLADRVAIAVDNAWLYRETDGARAAAEMANKAKLDFLASMSHELRTPLNAIAGYVQLLEMGVGGPVVDDQRRYLARIGRAQSLLLGRINDMLNFVKIGSGTLTYVLRAVPVHETLAGLDGMIQPQLIDRGLTYRYIATDPAIMVSADPEKLEQILLNLLSNAIKFTPRGGTITVACQAREDQIEISVSDTGVGIPQEKLPAIFEPFVQLNASLTSDREGTGLGLAISRDLARAMGGELLVASEPGEGSTFVIVLPRAGATAPDGATAPFAAEAAETR